MMNNDNDISPEDEPAEIESPVDGPTLDWMSSMASPTTGGSDEDAPDWLSDIKAGKSPSAQEPETQSDDDPYTGMSDLERLLAEEGVDLGTVAEDRPEGSEGMSTRDWMIATSDDEMIRKIAEDEAEVAAAPSTAQAAPQPEPETAVSGGGDDPYAGMSDLERLLAQEGVDLGTVDEERPEGSEGMSARDWMINTSDDELIRKKVGADPLPDTKPLTETARSTKTKPPLPPAKPESSTTAAPPPAPKPEHVSEAPIPIPASNADDKDDKMVVEADLPDWLQEADDTPSAPAHASTTPPIAAPIAPSEPTPPISSAPISALTDDDDDKMVVEDDLPDWLQEADDGLPHESTTSASLAPISPPDDDEDDDDDDDDKMVVEDGLPDWLQEAEDEDESFSPEHVVGDGGDDDLPDWLQEPEMDESPSASVAIANDDDKMVVENGLPDWLQDVEDEGKTFAQEPVVGVGGGDDDLPDWLQDAGDEDEVFAQEPVVGSGGDDDLPDWLQEAGDEDEVFAQEPVVGSGGDDDLPDWLQDAGDEDETFAQEPVVSGGGDDDLSTRLQDAKDEDETFAQEPVVGGGDDDDLSAWLQDAKDEDETFAQEPVVSGGGDDGLPDWLQDAEDEGETFVQEPVVSGGGDDGLPDWLQEAEMDESPSASVPIVDDDDKMVVENGLPDWLQDAEDEDETFSQEPIVAGDDDDLPAWLREAETDESSPAPGPTVMENDDKMIVDDNLPDWLTEVEEGDPKISTPAPIPAPPSSEDDDSAAAEDSADNDDLPDWLKEVEDDEVADSDSVVSGPEPIIENEADDDFATEEKIPAWLKEAQAESDANQVAEDKTEDDDLPSWLQEVEDTTEPLFSDGGQLDDIGVDTDLPEWLNDMDEPFESSDSDAQNLDDDLPDWLAQEDTLDFEVEADISTPADTFVSEHEGKPDRVEEDLPGWLQDEGEEVEEPTIVETKVGEEKVRPEEPVPITQSALPQTNSTPSNDMPDWLKKLRQPGSPEESSPPIVSQPVTVPVPTPKPQPKVQPQFGGEVAVVQPAEYPADAKPLPDDANERLSLAQTACKKGEIKESVRIYRSLITKSLFLDTIIGDIQKATKEYPTNYLLFQVMGDAMMQDGRLNSALESYREALEKLSR